MKRNTRECTIPSHPIKLFPVASHSATGKVRTKLVRVAQFTRPTEARDGKRAGSILGANLAVARLPCRGLGEHKVRPYNSQRDSFLRSCLRVQGTAPAGGALSGFDRSYGTASTPVSGFSRIGRWREPKSVDVIVSTLGLYPSRQTPHRAQSQSGTSYLSKKRLLIRSS